MFLCINHMRSYRRGYDKLRDGIQMSYKRVNWSKMSRYGRMYVTRGNKERVSGINGVAKG